MQISSRPMCMHACVQMLQLNSLQNVGNWPEDILRQRFIEQGPIW